ncbi:MAG: AzlC family ABC transporter permease [Rhodovarius sp.]|nr:AzlC family ABC transporter permease [Rhodovarius sp.]MDW8313711.1 AzlC family ABC transporter permease [Rhodovarius sp.]
MAFRAGLAEAAGAPAVAMAATFLGFGAAVAAAGLPPAWGLLAALLVYGMPGQLILLSALVQGGGVGAAVLGAAAANARFLPMAVALCPWLGGGRGRWLALPFIAVTPWVGGMRSLPGLPAEQRLSWFLGFALGCWAVAGMATLAGLALAPVLPSWLLALLVFSNPLYFALMLALDRRSPATRRAVVAGVLAAPAALLLPPAWGLLAAGLVGGTAAFLVGRRA